MQEAGCLPDIHKENRAAAFPIHFYCFVIVILLFIAVNHGIAFSQSHTGVRTIARRTGSGVVSVESPNAEII